MMQLLGGVAVAGIVAAGSSAFTGYGASTVATTPYLGGTFHQAVSGATLMTVALTTTADLSNSQVTEILLTFDSDTPTGKAVTLVSDGTLGGAGTPTGIYCQATQANFTSNCKVGTSYAAPTGYKTNIKDLTITVA
ncbi:hypothetical protein [Actinoplanes sp. L3-i22]|uniref:hypothetical protein n=1 Tax=Actinoplanes sp. L3-i22 TaxID=2836373 RepID=UPI001C8599D2|nr:hypothetical protein [Actinoplanes sp. L3-i22]